MGPAIISMEGTVQWRQMKAGCIAVADFLGSAPSANQAGLENLPPPPPPSKEPAPPTTFSAEGVKLDAKHQEDLRKLAVERDE